MNEKRKRRFVQKSIKKKKSKDEICLKQIQKRKEKENIKNGSTKERETSK